MALKIARPDGLLRGLRPLVLRFAPDRRRCAAASNLAEAGQVVEPACRLSGVRINTPVSLTDRRFSRKKTVARPERFELPTTWFEGRHSIVRNPMILNSSHY